MGNKCIRKKPEPVVQKVENDSEGDSASVSEVSEAEKEEAQRRQREVSENRTTYIAFSVSLET